MRPHAITREASLSAALLFGGAALAARDGICPPLGAVLPAPTHPSTNSDVQDSFKSITDYLHTNVTSGWNASGVAVAIQSIHETKPMYEFYYTPPNLNTSGTAEINSETVFRVGSISKMFSILSVLTEGSIKLEDPVTKYIPELLQLFKEASVVNNITTVNWDQVTVGSLASHIGGIGSDLVNDLASFPYPFTEFGLPTISNSSKTACAGILGLPSCTRAEFFRDFGKRHPVYAPYTNPVYSNIGSVLLGFVVEAASESSYSDYVQKAILNPLGMTNTTVFNGPRDTSWGFIPEGDIYFDHSLGYEDIAGGFYSNTVDLLSFSTGILTSKLLEPVLTRQWMKPQTSTSSSGTQFGGFWEIYRTSSITHDQRLLEIYTKSGNLGSYNSVMVLIPDYDVVFTILTAGAESSEDQVDYMHSAIVRALVPALESAGKEQASSAFAGTYTDKATNSSITIVTDDGPGFSVTNWTVRNTDIIASFPTFASESTTAVKETLRIRLYPTNLAAGSAECSTTSGYSASSGCSSTAWRAVFQEGSTEQLAQGDALRYWPGGSCITDLEIDRVVYGFKALDEFVFHLGNGGKAQSLDLRAFEVTLSKAATY
ncbi:beta-lactamase/transpeptidase-like protein [Xylariaceae sp. FL0255]|nr:beta-lactamase/transpeptidase-like protein [Xylariaceae sp. FL0255]